MLGLWIGGRRGLVFVGVDRRPRHRHHSEHYLTVNSVTHL